MNERLDRILEELATIAQTLHEVKVLKEHELGVRVERDPEGHGPHIPTGSDEQGQR